MNRNLGEIVVTLSFGFLTVLGFVASQSRQPYDLTQIRFCPVSINGIEGQRELDEVYCRVQRYVLREDWERYGQYGSIIPYKGEAIQFVRNLPTDNPHQLVGNFAIVFGLWGMAGTGMIRKHRLQVKDYEMSEREKSYNYKYWLERYSERHKENVSTNSDLAINDHKINLHTDKVKDGLSAVDGQERDELGLSSPDTRAFQAKLELEDFLKARATKQSIQDKHFAENQLAIAKANAEREEILNQGLNGKSGQSIKGGKELHPSEKEAWETIERIATADNSTALIAGSGSGKSVTLNNILKIIIDKHPDADIDVIAAKNDSFYGLADKGRVLVYEIGDPGRCQDKLNDFYQRYLDRKSMPEDKRADLPPLILILDDWLVVAKQIKDADPKYNFSGMLLDILTIGREFNCKFMASLQSFNLNALGIKDIDAQIRLNLNLLSLGNRYKRKDGQLLESYGVIETLLNRDDIIPQKDRRSRLKETYQEIRKVSYDNLRPVMLASFGDYTTALMPYLTKPKPESATKKELDPYKEVSNWSKGKSPADSALIEKWEELTGEKPNVTELEILKEHINAIKGD